MLLDLIEKLVSRCIELTEYRRKRRRALLEEFVEPVMQTFEEVHVSYLNSFKDLRETVSSGEDMGGMSWSDRLSTDSLLSHSQREQLLRASDRLKNPHLTQLLFAIRDYLGVTESRKRLVQSSSIRSLSLVAEELIANALRHSLDTTMRRSVFQHSSTDDKALRRILLADIDDAIARIQQQHATVNSKYQEARVKLIGD